MPIGSKFDDCLKDIGIFETTSAAAIKKVLALQIEEEMQAHHHTKTATAIKAPPMPNDNPPTRQ